MNGRYLHLPAEAEPANVEADDAWEPACSCGGDPDTCEANRAVAAEIQAADEEAQR